MYAKFFIVVQKDKNLKAESRPLKCNIKLKIQLYPVYTRYVYFHVENATEVSAYL